MSDRRSSKRSRSPESDPGRSEDGDKSSKGRHSRRRPDGAPRLSGSSTDDLRAYYGSFETWLLDHRSKQARKMDGETERHYWRKFVRRWNEGALSSRFYGPVASRDGVRLGPALPEDISMVDRVRGKREYEQMEMEQRKERAEHERKRERRERKDEERDSRATGKERLIEKRAEKAASARAMAQARESGGMQEFDDDTLMGGGGDSSFQAALAARDRARSRNKKAMIREEKQAELADRAREMRTKEDETMNMLRQLAAARYSNNNS